MSLLDAVRLFRWMSFVFVPLIVIYRLIDLSHCIPLNINDLSKDRYHSQVVIHDRGPYIKQPNSPVITDA